MTPGSLPPPALPPPAALDFPTLARLVLAYLSEHVPLALWSVTRVENDRQTFLYLNEGNGYGKERGDSHPWEDSFCIHMAAGTAPMVAPDAQAIALYAAAGVNASTTIGAYAGAPIEDADGTLFGAICGLDPESRIDSVALQEAGPLLAFFGSLLTLALRSDRERERVALSLLEASIAAETDPLTALPNRRSWDQEIADEDRRFNRYGDPTIVVMLDLDGLKAVNDTQGHAEGDRYICACADVIRECVTARDAVARLGGDEFGVLLRGCTEAQAPSVVARLERSLAADGVAASIGWAPLTTRGGVPRALEEAELAMYEMKRLHHRQRG